MFPNIQHKITQINPITRKLKIKIPLLLKLKNGFEQSTLVLQRNGKKSIIINFKGQRNQRNEEKNYLDHLISRNWLSSMVSTLLNEGLGD